MSSNVFGKMWRIVSSTDTILIVAINVTYRSRDAHNGVGWPTQIKAVHNIVLTDVNIILSNRLENDIVNIFSSRTAAQSLHYLNVTCGARTQPPGVALRKNEKLKYFYNTRVLYIPADGAKRLTVDTALIIYYSTQFKSTHSACINSQLWPTFFFFFYQNEKFWEGCNGLLSTSGYSHIVVV